jgi:histidyl-tRNA synthetase
MIKEVFKGLGIRDYSIKINHRGILNGIADVIGAKGNETPMFVAIDKLDKIGEEKVKEELRTKNFSEESLTALFQVLHAKGSNTNKLAFLAGKFETTAAGQKGLRDLKEVFGVLENYGSDDKNVEFDVSLARGLSYYTGCIFEVKINNVSIGSVSGGGRYDNLTQAFGDKENLSGVGFSCNGGA